MQPTSLTLLDRLRQSDDQAAWGRFVRLYEPLLLHWAAREGLQPADAADVTQEVLVKLVGLLPEYRRGDGQSFRGWLRRVTWSQCRDFRRRRATRGMPGADGLSGVADAPPDDTEEDDRRVLVARGLELVRSDFSERTWEAFTRIADGEPAAQVGAALGITENAVYLARNRVLTRLRQELDGLLD